MNTPTHSDVRLIATDIDGTLLNSRHELSERFYPVYNALRARVAGSCLLLPADASSTISTTVFRR